MIDIKDCKSVWNNCLSVIKEMVPETSFKTWFEPIEPISLNNSVLTIKVPNRFFYEWLEEHFVHVLKQAIHTELGANARLEYVIAGEQKAENKIYNINLQSKNNRGDVNSPTNSNNQELIDHLGIETELSSKYQFENFIEGDCNRLARSAGMAVAARPGQTAFNPLMIYSKVGLGKTHLVQAVGNTIKKNVTNKKLIYTTSDKFANQFMEAVKNNNIREFSAYFMKTDILIIEDVQFFSNKEKTQEIFFHIFNDLHQAGKQIIMTSDRSPKDLVGFQERLLSRFKWGMTADMQTPDFETRLAIIKKKSEILGVEIPSDVVEYLAYSIDTNLRDLEGVIVTLQGKSSLLQKEIDLELAKETINTIVQNVESEVGIDYIMKFVSEYFNVTIEHMKAKTRKREIVVARQISMFLAKEYTNMSLKSIGSHFGNRDHSTVIHAIQTVNDQMDTDKKFNNTMQDVLKKIKLKAQR